MAPDIHNLRTEWTTIESPNACRPIDLRPRWVRLLSRRKRRLQVVSNFGDSGEIHARAKMGSHEETCQEGRHQKLVARLLAEAHFRTCVYFAGIAKIRDFSQSSVNVVLCVFFIQTNLYKVFPMQISQPFVS